MPDSNERPIDDEWRRWIAENLMLDQCRERILATLKTKGFDEVLAAREIDSALASPYFQGARRLRNRLKKHDWVLEIHRRLNRALPSGNTVEVRERLSRDEFLRDYYTTNRPVLIRGMLENWPARSLWSPQSLRERFGSREIQVQTRRGTNPRYEVESARHREVMRMDEYVDLITRSGETNEYYITANNSSHNFQALRELWDDIIQIPEYLDGTAAQRGFFWFGPAGTITPLHHDLTNNFMAQVYGRKLVRLIPSCDLPYVRNELHCYSAVDAGNPDFERYPEFRQARVIDCVIGPGDLLFLPVGWWHYVKGLEISMTVSFTNFRFDNDFHSMYATYEDV